MENLMMCLTQRMVLGVTVPGIRLALVPTSWGQGCCCGGMNPAMLQNLQIQLMQRQYALQQQNSQTGILQNTINQLATQSESAVRASLKDEQVLVRLSAAYVAGEKRLSLQDDLIKMLTDKNGTIRHVAPLILVKLSMTTTPTPPATQR